MAYSGYKKGQVKKARKVKASLTRPQRAKAASVRSITRTASSPSYTGKGPGRGAPLRTSKKAVRKRRVNRAVRRSNQSNLGIKNPAIRQRVAKKAVKKYGKNSVNVNKNIKRAAKGKKR